jgi:sulfonate transport system permease protein
MSGTSLLLEQEARQHRIAMPWRSSLRKARRRLISVAMPLLVPVAAVLLWIAFSREGWLSRQILPAPSYVASSIVDLWQSGDLTRDTGISLVRVLGGFAIGGAVGLMLGVVMGLSSKIEDYARPLFTILVQVPTIGWIPLLMIPLGIGEPLKLIIIAKAALVPTALNTLNGIRAVPAAWLEVASVFRYSRNQLLRHVIIPAAVPPIFTGIRYGLADAWKALVAVELLASSEGLGYQLVWGRQMMEMDVVVAVMAVIAIIGLILDTTLAVVERRLQIWKGAGA